MGRRGAKIHGDWSGSSHSKGLGPVWPFQRRRRRLRGRCLTALLRPMLPTSQRLMKRSHRNLLTRGTAGYFHGQDQSKVRSFTLSCIREVDVPLAGERSP